MSIAFTSLTCSAAHPKMRLFRTAFIPDLVAIFGRRVL